MKTGFNDLDQRIKLNKKQVLLISSRDEIKNIFALNLVKNIAIDKKIETALFTNLDLIDEEEQFKIYTQDILTSICSKVEINKIIDNRYLKTTLTKEELKAVKEEGKIEVYFDEVNGQKLYITKEILNDEEEKSVYESYKKIKDAPLYISVTQEITINQFREKCINLKKEKNIQLIVTSTDMISDNKVHILKALKELAKELEVLILVTIATIENNNIPLKQEIKELAEIMHITDITIYLETGKEEEKGIVHCIIDTNNKKNIVDLLYLMKYNKFVDLISKF